MIVNVRAFTRTLLKGPILYIPFESDDPKVKKEPLHLPDEMKLVLHRFILTEQIFLMRWPHRWAQ